MRLKVTGVMIALALTVVATVTYGPSIVDLYRRAATYVAKAPAIRVMLGHCLPQIGGRIIETCISNVLLVPRTPHPT